MKGKTVDELRALARSRGMKGYSRLTKDGLVRLLSGKKSATLVSPKTKKKKIKAGTAAAPKARKKSPVPRSTGKRRAAVPAPARNIQARHKKQLPAPADDQAATGAKFAIDMPGTHRAQPAAAQTLHEPIDRLPALPLPMLVVLQQKPGSVHISWQISPESPAAAGSAHLRVLQGVPGAIKVIHDVPLPATHGSRYFLLDTANPQHAITVQIGHYPANGAFITDLQHTAARLPDARPATQTHPQWWISAQDFARLYLHGGGQSHALSDHNSSW